VAQPDQPLAEILPAVERGDRTRTSLEAVADILAIADAAFAQPGGEACYRFFRAVLIVGREKSCHARPLDQEVPLDAGTQRPRIPARDRGGTADYHAGVDREARKHRVGDRSCGIVEIDVDAAGASSRQCFIE